MRIDRIILLIALLLAACSAVQERTTPAEAADVAWIAEQRELGSSTGAPRSSGLLTDTPSVSFFSAVDADDSGGRTGPAERGPTEPRKIVYTGAIAIEVPRVDDALSRLREHVESIAGYLERRDGNAVTFRVPADRFESALGFCRTLGRVLHERQEAIDVTDQWADLGIRLENARSSRQRLLDLLERADAVKDVLEIERELRRLTTEIEQMETQLKALEDRVAMATLTVELVPVSTSRPIDRSAGPSRFRWINLVGADRAMRAF